MSAEQRLADLGLVLPVPASPLANYVPVTRSGNLLNVSGQLALGADGKIDPAHRGKLGRDLDEAAGRAAARACAINVLAQLRANLGSLDRVTRCLRLGGYICAAPGFTALAPVMNGASDLMVDVFGDMGRHARTTVGVAELPLESAVEVDGMFEIA